MSSGKEIEDNIRSLLGERRPRSKTPSNTTHNNNQANIGSVSGHVGSVVVGDNNAIIINDARRPGERIDDDQLRELRERMVSLIKIDALLASRNPKDKRPHAQRLETARRKRWHQFRDAFRLNSYTHLTHGQYDEALQWIARRKDEALSTLDRKQVERGTRKRPPSRALRLTCLFLLALCVPLLFSVSQNRPPDNMITGPIAAIAVAHPPAIQPAGLGNHVIPSTESPCQPYFECHAGCSFFKPSQPMNKGRSI